MTTGGSTSQEDRISQFLHTVRRDEKRSHQVVRTSERSVTGLWVGTLVGLAYGSVSQSINGWSLPGLPLIHAPFDVTGNILLYGLAGAIVGVAAGLPRGGLSGVTAAAVVGAALLQVFAWFAQVTETLFSNFGVELAASAAVFGIAASILFMLLVGMLIRWAIEVLGEEKDRGVRSWARLRAVFLPILLAAAAGMLARYDGADIVGLQRTHALIQQNLAAQTSEELNRALRTKHVTGFLQRPGNDYVLQPDDRLRYLIPAPDVVDLQSAVMARFGRSYILVCGYGLDGNDLYCVDFLSAPDERLQRTAQGEEQPDGLS